MINKKHVKIIDLVLVVGTLFFVVGGYLISSPEREIMLSPGEPLFVVQGEKIFLFDKDFSKPDVIYPYEGLVVTLDKGVYYLKDSSEIRKLTIEEDVSFVFRELEGGFGLFSAEDENLEVDIYNSVGEPLERVVLPGGSNE